MGKSKRRKIQERGSGPKHNSKGPTKPHAKTTQQTNPSTKNKPPKTDSSNPKPSTQHQEPTIPFDALDRILVIGDGDLSFSRSLVDTHGCAELLATTYDSSTELFSKYPQAQENKEAIEAEEQKVLHGVDATKLSQKEVKKQAGGWERIVFNFPHVGGKSTDVNRQVRYNQEMLVSFFKTATPLLAPHGTIIVTLFEGEPYTLWNIRDLARHSGLEVQRSFRFQADAYPGYAHARTLGNIEGGGGWKGENRAARSYVFQNKGAGDVAQKKQVKKRKKEESEDEDDEEN